MITSITFINLTRRIGYDTGQLIVYNNFQVMHIFNNFFDKRFKIGSTVNFLLVNFFDKWFKIGSTVNFLLVISYIFQSNRIFRISLYCQRRIHNSVKRLRRKFLQK